MAAEGHLHLSIVLDHPVQHFSPGFRELDRSTVLDTTVLYWVTAEGGFYDPQFARTIKWDIDLLSDYRWWAPSQSSTLPARIIATWRRLSDCTPDAIVVFGWATPNVLVALAWNFVHRRRLYFYGDSTWQHERGGFLGRARRVVMRVLFRAATGAIATGTFNREFYIRHGMHPSRIAQGNCPADIDFYAAGAGRSKEAGRNPTLVIGCAGKLIPIKGVHELLCAASLLDDDDNWELRIIGDGPERGNLELLAAELGIAGRVRFEGFKNQTEMPAALADCDVVVVPSTVDRRSLATTEAMAAGCAVVVSSNTAVWGPGDLLDDERTGLVYESGNPLALAHQLGRLITCRDLVARLVAEASSRLHEQGPVMFARHVEAEVRRVE